MAKAKEIQMKLLTAYYKHLDARPTDFKEAAFYTEDGVFYADFPYSELSIQAGDDGKLKPRVTAISYLDSTELAYFARLTRIISTLPNSLLE